MLTNVFAGSEAAGPGGRQGWSWRRLPLRRVGSAPLWGPAFAAALTLPIFSATAQPTPTGLPATPNALPRPTPDASAQPGLPRQDPDFGDDPSPPADLVVLVKKATLKGRWRLGVYDRQPDPSQPQVWRLKIWEQTEDRVFVSTDVLNCSPTQPMRITGGGADSRGVLILRELNPGGSITPANRLDHQVWWAACFPEQAGKDPAILGAEARRLGFSGSRVEREQVVPGARRP